MRTIFPAAGLLVLLFAAPLVQADEKTVTAYQLSYEEQEAGTEAFKTQYIITDRFLRINGLSDDDGFILYDDKTRTIYSVSHFDGRTLVMKNSDYKKIDINKLVNTTYQSLADAPAISGRPVYRYRVSARGQEGAVCADIQLAEALLPEVTRVLQHYKEVMAANQVTNLHKTPDEFRTPCYIADQVYDAGEYYSKGLPILEWHSNNSLKTLLNFEKVEVSPKIFVNPEGYKEFNLPP
jgi:hypothetical protein